MCVCVFTCAHLHDIYTVYYFFHPFHPDMGEKNSPNPILVQLVNKDLRRYKPTPSDIRDCFFN